MVRSARQFTWKCVSVVFLVKGRRRGWMARFLPCFFAIVHLMDKINCQTFSCERSIRFQKSNICTRNKKFGSWFFVESMCHVYSSGAFEVRTHMILGFSILLCPTALLCTSRTHTVCQLTIDTTPISRTIVPFHHRNCWSLVLVPIVDGMWGWIVEIWAWLGQTFIKNWERSCWIWQMFCWVFVPIVADGYTRNNYTNC